MSYFVLILAKRVLAACLCCAFYTAAFAGEEGSESAFSSGNFHLSDNSEYKEQLDRTSDLALFAVGLAGIQYKYGGTSPDAGMDCSGLVRYVFKEILDKDLPRSSEEISHVGSAIEDHELQPGDLVFFNTLKRAFSHVGIYLGDDKFIHSPASGGKVRIENMTIRYWKQRFNGARRIIGWRDASP